MGKQIVKQPNGKYCIFSTVVDNLTHTNLTANEIIKEYQNQYGIFGKEKAEKIINQLENNEKPYFQFNYSIEEILEIIKLNHGNDTAEKILQLILK